MKLKERVKEMALKAFEKSSIPCIHCMYLLGEFRFSAFLNKSVRDVSGSESKVWRPVSVAWKLRNTQFVKTKSKSVWDAGKYEAASKMSL